MDDKLVEDISKDSIVRVFHLYKRFGGKCALYDLSFDIKRNEFVYFIGPSGAGKSTLFELLYKKIDASEGQILVDGINYSRLSKKKVPFLRRKIGVVFQDFKLIPTKTVFENVALVLEVSGKKKSYIQKKVRSVLRIIGLESKKDSYPVGLSGGEQQRVAVARAVVGEPQIIFADEPTGSLDSESAETIMDLLKSFHIKGATVIVATHDSGLIEKTGGRIINLKDGRIIM
ncbi:MAG: cell division ATP-binding protein FtsE [Desulfobacterales bacterium]|nr:cell division ATP-binding protein FtsE [Desulfobacterales bacterium]MCP4161013.1 cell division ATP-binding protein FtsE [Deltaproteobacteria bacterium]